MNYLECLPQEVSNCLQGVQNVREVRLRNGRCTRVNVDGKWFWIGSKGLQTSEKNAFVLGDVCDDVIKNACNRSVYAYEKMLANGFFTLSDGTRIGVCGVLGGNTFQKYTSLCLRTATYHACADTFFDGSVIVVGAPRSGKTTYLRDFACKVSHSCNVVVVDERGEIANCKGFIAQSCCDVLQYATKSYALEVAVRSLSPDWIVCDELSQTELNLLENFCASGVKMAASIHANSLNDLKLKLGSRLEYFCYAVFLQKDSFKKSVVDLKNNRTIL